MFLRETNINILLLLLLIVDYNNVVYLKKKYLTCFYYEECFIFVFAYTYIKKYSEIYIHFQTTFVVSLSLY